MTQRAKPAPPRARRSSSDRSSRRTLYLNLAFLVAILLGTATLVGAAFASYAGTHWAEVANVNGVTINRDQAQAAANVDLFKLTNQVSQLRNDLAAGRISQADSDAQSATLTQAEQNVSAGVVDALVDDELQRQLAATAGITITVHGEVNDGCGKGLSGGRIVVLPPTNARRRADDNVIAGNVLLYGATSGEMFVRGVAGERFAVRNSGAQAVVEGTGDHALEYMTGGVVVILGRTGRNVAAGMSGGLAYVLNVDGSFGQRCNTGMVRLLAPDDENDGPVVRELLERHLAYTQSPVAEELLENWPLSLSRFIKILPVDYERALAARRTALGVAV